MVLLIGVVRVCNTLLNAPLPPFSTERRVSGRKVEGDALLVALLRYPYRDFRIASSAAARPG